MDPNGSVAVAFGKKICVFNPACCTLAPGIEVDDVITNSDSDNDNGSSDNDSGSGDNNNGSGDNDSGSGDNDSGSIILSGSNNEERKGCLLYALFSVTTIHANVSIEN